MRRRKGSRNRLPATVQQCILDAATRIGSDGHGRDGVTGFLEATGRENPTALAAGLYKLVPPPKESDGVSVSGGPVTINILPVASGTYLGPEDIARLHAREPLQFAPVEPPSEETISGRPVLVIDNVVEPDEPEPPPAA